MKDNLLVDLIEICLRAAIFAIAAEYISDRTAKKVYDMYH